MIEFDTSQIGRLGASFDRSTRRAGPAMGPIVRQAANNIRTEAARRASGIGHAPHYPRSITVDLLVWPRGAEAEVGPDKDKRQGALGNILEYGTSKNAPIPHLAPAFEAERAPFERALLDAEAALLDD